VYRGPCMKITPLNSYITYTHVHFEKTRLTTLAFCALAKISKSCVNYLRQRQ